MDLKLCFLILCMLMQEIWSRQGLTLRQRRILPCIFESKLSSNDSQWLVASELTQRKAWLVPRSMSGSLDSDGVKFIFKESSVNFIQFLKDDGYDLVCEIKVYFTDNIQILWPGIQMKESTLDSWFTNTIKHINNNFHLTIFFTKLSERQLNEDAVPHLYSSHGDVLHVSAAFMLSTKTPVVQTRLNANVLLDCKFSVDHKAVVNIQWSLRRKGGQKFTILSYNGSTKLIKYHLKGISMNVEGIPNGSASLLLTSMTVDNEGVYFCSVSVSSLYADQEIHVQVVESPTVTINADSLLLSEGLEHKLVCDASYYYPLDVSIEWLREQPNQKLLPTVLKNVLLKSHKLHSNGTYSLSSFFMLTAALQDDGAVYTCRVEHASLKHPIRRSVKISVQRATIWEYHLLILGIIVTAFVGFLLIMLKYLQNGPVTNMFVSALGRHKTAC
ncbi:tapasin-related protein isoform X2 [Bombina bombina]|uniref:tapasin-related protein isoform X2 n=1 Tax=Bombina bombina TaxID=8345 RepID=UPI00235A7004|nr:tapasin-related protein isoform X2 [Bombina bombina]